MGFVTVSIRAWVTVAHASRIVVVLQHMQPKPTYWCWTLHVLCLAQVRARAQRDKLPRAVLYQTRCIDHLLTSWIREQYRTNLCYVSKLSM